MHWHVYCILSSYVCIECVCVCCSDWCLDWRRHLESEHREKANLSLVWMKGNTSMPLCFAVDCLNYLKGTPTHFSSTFTFIFHFFILFTLFTQIYHCSMLSLYLFYPLKAHLDILLSLIRSSEALGPARGHVGLNAPKVRPPSAQWKIHQSLGATELSKILRPSTVLICQVPMGVGVWEGGR